MPQVHVDMNLGTEIDPKPLSHQAPVLTFDGTLIDDMSFETQKAQVVSVSNLPVRSAGNPTFSRDQWLANQPSPRTLKSGQPYSRGE